jgi:two-component sensor histidine kinase
MPSPATGGRVFVQLGREGDDWRLTVADDGCGGRDRIQPGFGLRLLGLLARQLRGRLDIGPGLDGCGLSVSAVFPMPEAHVPRIRQRLGEVGGRRPDVRPVLQV